MPGPTAHDHLDSIEEDDEKFTIKVKLRFGGSVNLWPRHGKTKKGHPWSWNQKGLSYYVPIARQSWK